MGKYFKLFNTHSQYEAFTGTSEFVLPNVSYCKDTPNEVHYNPTVAVTGVTLNKSALSLSKGTTETLVATVLPSNASNKNVTWSSSDDSVATVSNNGFVTAVGDSGNANITVTTVDGGHTAQCAFSILDPCASEIVHTTYEWVEIGGIKWATKNVGALTVTDYGQYFSWGGVNGYTDEQVTGSCHSKLFSWTDYELGNGGSSASNMTKYNASDGLTILDTADDAATVNMGAGWRMPTINEFQALGAAANTAWTANYNSTGVAGIVCTDKTDSSKVLFFPAAGYCYNSSVIGIGSNSIYWTSSLNTSKMERSFYILSYTGGMGWQNGTRCNGLTVRGVVG